MENNVFCRQLQILFGALSMAQILFLGVVSSFKLPHSGDAVPFEAFVSYAPALAIVLLLVGYYAFRWRLAKLANETDLAQKQGLYRAASLLKWTLFESATIVALMTYFMSGHPDMLYLGIASLVHFTLHFPTAARVEGFV